MGLSLAAIVLAGGRSSRMGRDKALILIEGKPLLQRVCQVALHCTPTVYVVTPWIQRYAAIVPPTCHRIQEQTMAGETSTQGPLIGFAQGLAQVQADWVLLLACDLPYLQAEVLQQWSRELPALQQVTAFLPRNAKGWEPLCGFYRVSCLSRIRQSIQAGNRSFQRWLAQESVREIPLDDRRLLFNCNTPADLESLDISSGGEGNRIARS